MAVNSMQVVLDLKESLLKELPVDKDDAVEKIERCSDILDRLSEAKINLSILTETLIGATVNKLKSHNTLGPKAKALVKSWKQVAAKEQENNNNNNETSGSEKNDKKGGAKKENSKKVERRESIESSSGEYDPESEWIGLPEQRHTICTKLYSILLTAKPALIKQGVNKAAVVHLTAPRTAEIENAIQNKFSNNKKGYVDKARSICFNLKKNIPLAVSVLLGQVEPDELVEFTAEQLASDDIRKKREETAKKLNDSKRLDWDQANEEKINKQCGIEGELLQASLFTCARCKSVKTTSTQKQTRSADEPMTVFVLCLNCGKRWKC